MQIFEAANDFETKPLTVNLPSDSSQKAKRRIFLAFPMEPKLFLKAAALEGDIADHLTHALVWAVRVVNSFWKKQSTKFAPCSFPAIFTASFAGTFYYDRTFCVAHSVLRYFSMLFKTQHFTFEINAVVYFSVLFFF